MKRLFIITCLVTLIEVAGWAQSGNPFGTGKWLHDCWTEEKRLETGDIKADVYNAGIYVGFVTGLSLLFRNASKSSVPDDVTNDQISVVVVNYLEKHPEEWHLPAYEIVIRAMQAAWPYKK